MLWMSIPPTSAAKHSQAGQSSQMCKTTHRIHSEPQIKHTHTYTHTHIHTYIHTHTHTHTHTHRHTNCRLRWKKTDLKHLRFSKNKGHTTSFTLEKEQTVLSYQYLEELLEFIGISLSSETKYFIFFSLKRHQKSFYIV